MCEGIVEELATVDLGDDRLNKRARKLIERLAADPSASINMASQGWAETQAAYRFFQNQSVEPEKLLAPHRQATLKRASEEPVVLLVQDTTELDYTAHPVEGMGVLNSEKRYGYYDHTMIAFTPLGLCLGVVEADFFERSIEDLGKSRERAKQPLETRESFRWIEAYRKASEMTVQTPETQIVCVADCEADMYDLLLEAQQHPTPAELLVRAKSPRSLPEKDPDVGPFAYRKAWDEVASCEVLGYRAISLAQTPKREARDAQLEVRAKRVTMRPPHTRQTEPEVTFNLVLVSEVDPPAGVEPIEWKLLTTLPIDSADATWRIVDYYAARWGIEVFFRVFKTGCQVEKIQLETTARLRNCLMLYKLIAWRVMYLTYLGRTVPDLPCSAVFGDLEWKLTWRIVKQEDPPETPPSLKDFLAVLAILGGYNNRKGDAPPGPQALWVALRRMTDFSIAWQTFEKESRSCV